MAQLDGRRLTDAEKREWLTQRGKVQRAPHAFTKKIKHWPYCARCGLMLLKNEASRKAASQPCEWEE